MFAQTAARQWIATMEERGSAAGVKEKALFNREPSAVAAPWRDKLRKTGTSPQNTQMDADEEFLSASAPNPGGRGIPGRGQATWMQFVNARSTAGKQFCG
jgi:hypothetical protein